MMRLLLDMGASPRTAVFLREHGHDALHLREEGLSRLPDGEVARKAEAEGRILVTFDLDFARILAMQGTVKPSMILFRLERFTTSQVNARLLAVLSECGEQLDQGAIVVVESTRMRVRRLPLL